MKRKGEFLQGIEKTLRDTLSKLGQPDESTRLKLYKATETILERSLAPYIHTKPAMVNKRRAELVGIVNKIEAEFAAHGSVGNVASEFASSQDHSTIQPVAPAPDTSLPNPVPADNTPDAELPPLDKMPGATSLPESDLDKEIALAAPAQAGAPSDLSVKSEEVEAFLWNDPDVDVDLAAVPDAPPNQRQGQQINLEWPDAATHPGDQLGPEPPIFQTETVAERSDPLFGDQPAQKAPEPTFTFPPDFPGNASAEPVGVDKKELKKQQKAEKAAAKKAKRAEARAKRSKKRRRGTGILDTIAAAVVTVIFLIFVLGGAWLFFESDYYDLFVEWRSGETSQPVVVDETQDNQDFIPKPLTVESEQAGDWITIFDADNADNVRGRGEVIVETIGDENVGGVRITSVTPTDFGEALVPLDNVRLEGAANQRFAIALSMYATEATQIYIRSLLKNGVEGARRRYQLEGGRSDVLINLDMTNVSSFERQSYIAINSDITGQGKPVELYDIKFQIINQ